MVHLVYIKPGSVPDKLCVVFPVNESSKQCCPMQACVAPARQLFSLVHSSDLIVHSLTVVGHPNLIHELPTSYAVPYSQGH